MTFIVLIRNKTDKHDTVALGPYRSFKAAEGDAKALDIHPRWTVVIPLTKLEELP